MGNWSPYSEEWEKQRIKRAIADAEAKRIAFEQKPRIYQAIVKFVSTIRYYFELLVIRVRMLFDRQYRDEVHHITEDDAKTLRAIVDILKDDDESS